ncbi:ribonuclease H-like domain-containing protein [Tanacetum coccineum]
MVLSIVVSRKWPIHQLDVKNAFRNGDLSETVYMHQPPSFVDARLCHTALLQHLIDALHREFDMTDLGALNYFLGIFIVRRSIVDTESKLRSDGVPIQDPTLYQNLVGGLQYLTFTRPDLSYAVKQMCLYMHDPREPHLAALKRILRYVQGTLDFGDLHYKLLPPLPIWLVILMLIGRCPTTRMSTLGYYVFLGDNLLSWSAKRQHTLLRSSAEAEYPGGVAHVVAETAWLCNLLRELHSPLSTATLVYCDNVSAVYMSVNPVSPSTDRNTCDPGPFQFVRDKVTAVI